MTNKISSDEPMGPTPENMATTIQKATVKSRGLPPVDKWNPELSGEMDMRIARNGIWYYLGSPINRPALVRLFSTILRKDDDDYVLVTPVEKWRITVEDVPFLAVNFEVGGTEEQPVLTFETNVGDFVTADLNYPIRVTKNPETGEPSPYILVRRNLEALIDRKSFYRLMDLGEHKIVDEENWFGVRSSGSFFPFIPSAQLE